MSYNWTNLKPGCSLERVVAARYLSGSSVQRANFTAKQSACRRPRSTNITVFAAHYDLRRPWTTSRPDPAWSDCLIFSILIDWLIDRLILAIERPSLYYACLSSLLDAQKRYDRDGVTGCLSKLTWFLLTGKRIRRRMLYKDAYWPLLCTTVMNEWTKFISLAKTVLRLTLDVLVVVVVFRVDVLLTTLITTLKYVQSLTYWYTIISQCLILCPKPTKHLQIGSIVSLVLNRLSLVGFWARDITFLPSWVHNWITIIIRITAVYHRFVYEQL